jgi:hypothetical protein
MANNIFKKAKAYQRKHPRIEWQECIQRVKGKKRKQVGTVKKKKSYRQTGTSNKAYDRRVKAKAPGARIPAGGNHVTYYERRKNRSDKPGSLTGMTSSQLKSELRKRLKGELGQNLIKKSLATTKRDRAKWGREATRVRKEYSKL